LIHYH